MIIYVTVCIQIIFNFRCWSGGCRSEIQIESATFINSWSTALEICISWIPIEQSKIKCFGCKKKKNKKTKNKNRLSLKVEKPFFVTKHPTHHHHHPRHNWGLIIYMISGVSLQKWHYYTLHWGSDTYSNKMMIAHNYYLWHFLKDAR